VPVAPRETIEALRAEVDEVVCLAMPEPFYAIGLHYRNFQQVEDERVEQLLRELRSERGAAGPTLRKRTPSSERRAKTADGDQ
jgi:predicted phosphoribosyltransferase